MKKVITKYDSPGKWNVIVPFDKVAEEKEWIGIIDARLTGDYELRVTADHSVPHTKGRIVVRAVVGAGATVKICGLIKIRKIAQGTDDFLELRVLTLDKDARAIVEPELEIEANDVKASHGASVGQIDKVQVLYLMSRGLNEKECMNEIVSGWLDIN